MRSLLIILALILLSPSLYSFKPSKSKDRNFNIASVRVVQVRSTPDPSTVTLKTIFPRPYENKRKNPINIQLRLENFTLGALSSHDRASEIYNHIEGQSIHVFIDDSPYFSCSVKVQNPVQDNSNVLDQILSCLVPFNLEPGQHVIRCFPTYSYGESLKKEGCFKTQIFYFHDPLKTHTFNYDPKGPYLTYNEPQGVYPVSKSNPILLDFYLTNCILSKDGYKIRFSINNQFVTTLIEWSPYYIYGLQKGRYLFKLELLDKNDILVSGCFNYQERDVIID